MSTTRRIALCLGLVLLLPLPALAEGPDWDGVADVETVVVVSANEDGTRRDTTVWLVVVDGQGYIRTGGTRWGANVKRDPDVELRIGEASWDLRADFVEDEGLRGEVEGAFREKYGTSDALISFFRGGHPLIMRLTSR